MDMTFRQFLAKYCEGVTIADAIGGVNYSEVNGVFITDADQVVSINLPLTDNTNNWVVGEKKEE